MSLNPADRQLSHDDLRALFSGDIRLREPVAYYLDENMMAEALIITLRAEGITATTVAERGLAGHPSDFVILADARQAGCVFVTRDGGYELLHYRLLAIPGISHAGILLFEGVLWPRRIESLLIQIAAKSRDYPINMIRQLVKYGW